MKTIKLIICVVFFQFFLHTYSQINTNIINQKTIGGNIADYIANIKKLSDGNYMMVGYSNSDISGEKSDTNRGQGDIWIVKVNSNLQIIWQKTIGGVLVDEASDFIECNNGSYLVFAESESPISGDKTTDTIGLSDLWLLKLDRDGNILWQKTYGGAKYESPKNIIKLDNGNFILSSSSESDSSGTKTQDSRGGYDFWITCIDSTGNIIWDKTLGSNGSDFIYSTINFFGNSILLCGGIFSDISGEVTQPSKGYDDIWLVKLDYDGNILWNKRYGGSYSELYPQLTFFENNIYILAKSDSPISGDKTEICRGYDDYWILKLNNEGEIIWDKTIGGNAPDDSQSLIITDEHQIIVGGSSLSNASFDKTENRVGNNSKPDYWVIGLDINANLLWQKTIGGNLNENLSQIISVNNNRFLVSGTSNSDIYGNKTEHCRGD